MDELKVRVEMDTFKGKVTINFMEILENLDEETKQELLKDGGWWSLVSKEMAEQIVNEFSRENYNEEYTKLRGMILNSEAMPKIIQEWAVSLIESRERSKERENYWSHAYWNLYHFCTENDIKTPHLPEDSYGKPYTAEFMAEVQKKADEWAKLFPEPVEEG